MCPHWPFRYNTSYLTSTYILTQFIQLLQMYTSNVYFKCILRLYTSNVYFEYILQTYTSNIYFEYIFQMYTSNVYFEYILQTHTSLVHVLYITLRKTYNFVTSLKLHSRWYFLTDYYNDTLTHMYTKHTTVKSVELIT